LWAKGLNANYIPVYGGNHFSCKAVHNWNEKLSEGRSKVADNSRRVRPVYMATEATVQRVEEFELTGG
jgi:hypothetical protein